LFEKKLKEFKAANKGKDTFKGFFAQAASYSDHEVDSYVSTSDVDLSPADIMVDEDLYVSKKKQKRKP